MKLGKLSFQNGSWLKTSKRILLIVHIVSLLITPSSRPAYAAAGDTTLVDVSKTGVPSSPGVDDPFSSVSGDGRYVAFTSRSNDLVPGDTNQANDVFVRDMINGVTTHISADSASPSISANGRYVAFSTVANLVVEDTNGVRDVYVHDLITGITELVSVATNGMQGNGGSGLWVESAISADGRFVVFQSAASNLVPNDTNMRDDIFVRDRLQNKTIQVNVDSNGTPANNASGQAVISVSGRFVAFQSAATNLVLTDTNHSNDVFVYDIQGKTTNLVSVSSDGIQGNASSGTPSISDDGKTIAFFSAADNLVSIDTSIYWNIYVHYTTTHTTNLVSIATDGTSGNGISLWPSISADGRFLAFSSTATNLIPQDTNGVTEDVFVSDLFSGNIKLVSVNSAEKQATSGGGFPAISSNGKFVSFASVSDDLVPNGNSQQHIYLHENKVSNVMFTISGNTGVGGVTLSYLNGSVKKVTSDANGSYSIMIPYNWAGTVTPSKSGYVFTPQNRVYTNVQSSQVGQDYSVVQPPLILIPGIGGSKLTNSVLGEQWPRLDYVACNDDSDAELRNLELDSTGTTDMWIQISVAGILLAETPKCHGVPIPFMGQHFYDGTIDAIQNAGFQYREDINNYQQGDNFFVFPYDWRKDVQVTAGELLTFIDTVRQKTGISQVDILAHSMGGLVTRVVLADPNSIGKIRKVLTLGTPVLGAPKTLGLLEYQSPCFVEGCVYDPAIFQEVVTNFPGVYELLPGPNYDQAAVEMPLLISRDLDGDGFFEGEQDYSKWSSIVAAHRNSAILTQSKIFHEIFDDFIMQDPLVQYVAFAGDGVRTPIQIRESISTDTPPIIKYEIKWSKHGDGTVPLYSSSLYNPITGYDIRNGAIVKIYSGVTHTGFPLDTTVLNDAISFFASPDNIFADSPSQDIVTTPSINPGTEIEISGSTEGYILDGSGNKSGQNDSLDGLVELNIPGSHYYAVADTQSYFFDNPDTYHAEYTANGDGIFIIRVSNYQDDNIKKVAVFGMNETPGAQAKLDYTSGQDVADIQVQIDTDGNGTIDETQSPDLILDGTTTTITSDNPDPSQPNQSVHVEVTVTGGDTNPTGVVDISGADTNPTGVVDISGADTNCQITLVDGTGGCDVVFATSGSKTLIATYNGDDTHLNSNDSEKHNVRIFKALKSTGTQDGWILESSEVSNKGGSVNTTANLLYIGDNAQDKQYRSILSFNTASLPDNAKITKVQLKIKVQGFAGGNMFTPSKTLGNLLIDIRKPYFGSNANLVVGDFQAAASKNSVGVLGSVSGTGWRTVTLKSAAYEFINLTGKTQFRLRFQKDDNDDLGADYLKIYSGDAPAASRPQLIIEYYIQ